MSQEPINVILLEPLIESVETLSRVLAKSKQVEILNVPTAEEALQVAQQFLPCVILVSIRGSLDGAPQLEMLKKLEKLIRAGQVKALVVSSVKKHPLARNIAEIGITDYAEEPIPSKSLLFKINLIFKAIIALKKRNEAKPEEQKIFKAGENKKKDESVSISSEVPAKYKPALQLGEDTFVFKGASPRKIGQKFILEAEGPLPDTGDWVAETGAGEKKKWKWVPKVHADESGADNSAKGDGWVHEGEKPAYEPRKGKWLLQSEKPRLTYYRDGREDGAKVETDAEGNIFIAEDSQAAKENLMLNKTLFAQAQEEIVNKIVAAQEKEKKEAEARALEKKKSEHIESNEERPPTDRQIKNGIFSNRLTEGKLDADRSVRDLRAAENSKRGTWGKGESSPAEKENSSSRQGSQNEREASPKFTRKINQEDLGGSGAENLELRTRERLLKGLKKEDLTGEQNLRDKLRADLKLRLEKEIPSEEMGVGSSGEKQDSPKQAPLGNLRESADPERDIGNSADLEVGQNEKAARNKQAEDAKEPDQGRAALPERKAQERAKRRIADLKKQVVTSSVDPEDENLSEEEERALRHELGALNRADLTKRELGKLARQEKLKAMKKEIHDLNESLEGRGAPLEALFPPEEDPGWHQHDGINDRAKRGFRAIESISEEFAGDFFGAEKNKKEKKSKKNAPEPSLFYLERLEVQPIEGSWECQKDHWIYLPNSIFAAGFESLEQVLPTWIFEGEPEPELLEKEEKWKFLGCAPLKVTAAQDLPEEILDLLENLLNQALMAQATPASSKAMEKARENLNKARSKPGADEKLNKHKGEENTTLDLESAADNPMAERALRARSREKASAAKTNEEDFGSVELEERHEDAERKGDVRNKKDSVRGTSIRKTEEESESGPSDPGFEEDTPLEPGDVNVNDVPKVGLGKVAAESEENADLGSVHGEDNSLELGKVRREEDADLTKVNDNAEGETLAQELRLSACELLVLVAIADAKRGKNALPQEIAVIQKTITLAMPGFQCRFSLGERDASPDEISVSPKSGGSALPKGVLLVVPSGGRVSLSRRELSLLELYATAMAPSGDFNQQQNETKAA